MRSSPALFVLLLPLAAGSLSIAPSPHRMRRTGSDEARGCASIAPRALERPSNAPPADFIVTASGGQQWLVNGLINPTLTLTRGQSYTFDLTAFNNEHPFVINANANNPFGTLYAGPSSGAIISFTPTAQMPSTIYYHCDVHYGSMKGTILLLGEGASCPGDLNNDLAVNITDFGLFVGAFGTGCTGCTADLNGDGTVNITDFGLLVGAFGSTCDLISPATIHGRVLAERERVRSW